MNELLGKLPDELHYHFKIKYVIRPTTDIIYLKNINAISV